MELPIYLKDMNHLTAAAAMNSVAVVPPRSPPRTTRRDVTISRVVPYENTQQLMMETNDSSIQGVAETLSILIVDDSSANRSG